MGRAEIQRLSQTVRRVMLRDVNFMRRKDLHGISRVYGSIRVAHRMGRTKLRVCGR
jgi:hypothetical protein